MKFRLSTEHSFNELEIATIIVAALFAGARIGLWIAERIF